MSLDVGENIKNARTKQNLTQAQLAERLHVTASMIAQYETGARNPKYPTVVKIADALGVEVGELYGTEVYYSSDIDLVDKNGNRQSYDPFYEVWTKDGVMTKTEFENEKNAGRMTDDDIIDLTLESRIDAAWHTLNDSGKEKATDQVELVAKVPEYRKK